MEDNKQIEFRTNKADYIEKAILCTRTFIPTSKENAIHLKDLSNNALVSEQKMKSIIQVARQNGEKIISGNIGYWYSNDAQEIERFCNLMRKQAKTRRDTIVCMFRKKGK